ncbi:MAG: DUF928 domain-containing protein [Nitrospira sp.]|nr:DUF928 domain-containing protein [Nitrospira sp.]MEB2337913.1 DUF928 domain-containing protein [Nitrospirales bacterium]QOJ34998.1 MAG: DUF928 domain-containing protein [Nitrospira sp.]
MSLLLMAALWLLCVGVPGGGAETDVPVYQAPQILAPRARLGGSLRGGEGDDPAIVALVPDHVGMTIKQRPAFNWFLSKHTTLPIRFTLIDERSVHALVEHTLPPPDQAGVHAVRLDELQFSLQPNVQYRWYISIIKDAASPSHDLVTGGMVERCDFSECSVLGASTACTRDAVLTSAARGFWYDAMACLCDLIEANPSDSALRRDRAALLKQVGLRDVAEWDLAQSHARRPERDSSAIPLVR